jgi:hypothetical protein
MISKSLEPKKAEVAERSPQPVEVKPITPEEQAIASRIMQEDTSWQTIGEESAVDYSLSNDMFALPLPAKKLEEEKKFRFRWITRTPQRLDQVKNLYPEFRRWWPVNSTQPVGGLFSSLIDPNNGCISREDQMLVFKPFWMAVKEREYKDKLADASFHKADKGGDGEEELAGGRRDPTKSKKALRQEIHGGDIPMGGEGYEESSGDSAEA